MTRLIVGVAAGLVLFASAAPCVTYRVPEQYATIQEAINVASPSHVDSVLVAPGRYIERLYIRKNLVLAGTGGAEATIVDGARTGNVITANGVGRDCIIQDLTLTGGFASDPDSVGAGIYLNQYASPTIQRCRLTGNNARSGGAINAFVDCEPLIRDCWIAHNEGGATVFEMGELQGTTWAELENTIIVHNLGPAVKVIRAARVWLRQCTISDNQGDGVRADEFARVRVQNCIITHNQGAGIGRLDATVCFVLQCNDVWSNTLGQQGGYLGTNPNDPCFAGRGSGDVSYNPCYQDAAGDNYHLQPTSPLCSLKQPGLCGQLGAYDDPCSGTIQPCPTDAVQPSSWSSVKQLYQ